MTTKSKNTDSNKPQAPKRRDFVVVTAGSVVAVGAAATAVPFVTSMNPAADVKALASVEVNISGMQPGDEKKVMWRGKPVFIKYRTPEEIKEATEVNWEKLPDPEPDSARVKEGKEQWLVTIGISTHLGCVPIGENAGEHNGWFCPCHGSHYDNSGRIRKGPAPKNLAIPQYSFVDDNTIKIG